MKNVSHFFNKYLTNDFQGLPQDVSSLPPLENHFYHMITLYLLCSSFKEVIVFHSEDTQTLSFY